MRMAPKLSAIFIMAVLLPSLAIGCVGMYLLAQLGEQSIESSRINAVCSEKIRLQQLAADKARIVEDFLSEYHRDVQTLQYLFAKTASGMVSIDAATEKTLYDGRDTAGLPPYGYVDEKFQAYANWDGLGNAGGLWLRKALVEKVRKNAAFAQEVSTMLVRLKSLMPMFEAIYEKHKISCDLVWVVTALGPVAVYPDEYPTAVRQNAELADLDETQEDYFKLFAPAANPTRETRWMQPYHDSIKRIWMTSCVAPLYDGDRFVGTVGIDVTIEDLVKWMAGLKIGMNGFAFLISADGVPLAMPASQTCRLIFDESLKAALTEALKPSEEQRWTSNLIEAMKINIASGAPERLAEIYSAMMNRNSGSEIVLLQDESYLVAYAPVRDAGWSIGIAVPVSEVLVPLKPFFDGIEKTKRRYVSGLIGLVTLFVLIAGAFGVWTGKRLAEPINGLINAIAQISRGGHWPQIEANTNDELKELTDNANVIMCRIAENEQMLDALFNGVNDAIFLCDADGVVLRANERTCEMFQCPQERIVGAKVGETDSKGFLSCIGQQIKNWLSRALNGETPIVEWQCHACNGRTFWAEFAFRCITLSGKNCVIATVRDITSRKESDNKLRQVEEQLHQAQKLESIGRLAGGIAHDVNNMLTPILGYSAMLEKSIDQPEQKSMVEQIMLAGERCKSLVSQLLTFAKKQTFEMKTISLNDVIREFQPILRQTFKENINIEYDLAPNLNYILGDAAQIQQILLNLGLNAQDAMPDGGKITYKTENVEICEGNLDKLLLPVGRYVKLTVADTGIGMPQEIIEHIFEPFFTVHRKSDRSGTGLGLAIVHGIVMQHNGRIEVLSEPGHGTAMQIYFPAVERQNSKKEAESKANGELIHGSGRVLVVEDDDMVRRLTVIMLEKLGFCTLVASTGNEAIAIYKREREFGSIDLILTDVVLPDMNGRKIIEAIKESTGENPKVLYMSGYTSNIIDEKGEIKAGEAFIQKPFNLGALAKKIRETLS